MSAAVRRSCQGEHPWRPPRWVGGGHGSQGLQLICKREHSLLPVARLWFREAQSIQVLCDMHALVHMLRGQQLRESVQALRLFPNELLALVNTGAV